MLRIISIWICLFGKIGISQHVYNHGIENDGDLIQLCEDISIPKIKAGYTLWKPSQNETKGLIVFFHSRRDTLEMDLLIQNALENQISVLYVTTENRVEFFFNEDKMCEVLTHIKTVCQNLELDASKTMYCGMSLAGTRALKMAIYGRNPCTMNTFQPKALIICDAPLDMVRFHKEMEKAEKLQYNAITSNEGKWVSAYLEQNLEGTPQTNQSAYINYSPFTYVGDNIDKLSSLRNISIRAYTEPDIEWWIKERGKDYYGMNSIDLAAFINELKLLGHTNANLKITQNKGYKPSGERHPHSWSIVNEKELITWFINQITKQ